MSQCKEFLEGRRIEEVKHERRKLVLKLDNGTTFTIGIRESWNDYDSSSCSLDFVFRSKLGRKLEYKKKKSRKEAQS